MDIKLVQNLANDNESGDLIAVVIPATAKVKEVDDLNGQFAPHSGTCQPEVIGYPPTVQASFTTDDSGNITAVLMDDWATVQRPEPPKETKATKTTKTPNKE